MGVGNIGEKTRLSRLINEKGYSFFLALDQGLEHGPSDFNEENVNPDFVIKTAVKAKYNGMILQKGGILDFFSPYVGKVPLIVKLNGRTNFDKKKNDYYSTQITSVKDAVKWGADAVGYTIYPGSKSESKMIKEFSKIESESRDYGLPVILWMYPRPKTSEVEKIKYAARIGMELGADFVKTYYTGNKKSFNEVVKNAPGTRILASGGSKEKTPLQLIKKMIDIRDSGAHGIAVGRNVWQSKTPVKTAILIKKIFNKKLNQSQALKLLK